MALGRGGRGEGGGGCPEGAGGASAAKIRAKTGEKDTRFLINPVFAGLSIVAGFGDRSLFLAFCLFAWMSFWFGFGKKDGAKLAFAWSSC